VIPKTIKFDAKIYIGLFSKFRKELIEFLIRFILMIINNVYSVKVSELLIRTVVK
jgi:hypothetical protein